MLRNKTEELSIVKEELVQSKKYGLRLKDEKEQL